MNIIILTIISIIILFLSAWYLSRRYRTRKLHKPLTKVAMVSDVVLNPVMQPTVSAEIISEKSNEVTINTIDDNSLSNIIEVVNVSVTPTGKTVDEIVNEIDFPAVSNISRLKNAARLVITLLFNKDVVCRKEINAIISDSFKAKTPTINIDKRDRVISQVILDLLFTSGIISKHFDEKHKQKILYSLNSGIRDSLRAGKNDISLMVINEILKKLREEISDITKTKQERIMEAADHVLHEIHDQGFIVREDLDVLCEGQITIESKFGDSAVPLSYVVITYLHKIGFMITIDEPVRGRQGRYGLNRSACTEICNNLNINSGIYWTSKFNNQSIYPDKNDDLGICDIVSDIIQTPMNNTAHVAAYMVF
jgi:hypothetical protein